MATNTLTRGSRSSGIISKDNIHLQRYLRAKIGLTPEEIAKEHKVSVQAVKASIARIDSYRALHTLDFANEGIVGLLIDVLPDTKSALVRGMKAKKRVTVGNRTELVDDILMQQKAVENVKELAMVIQPKGGKPVNVQVSANANAQSAVVSHSETRVMGMEENLRAISQRVEAETRQKSEVGTTFDDEVPDDGEAEEEEEDEPRVLEGDVEAT